MSPCRMAAGACLVLLLLVACGGGTLAVPPAFSAPVAAPLAPSPPAGPCSYAGLGPDPICTPGAIAGAVTEANLAATICRAGYASSVRPPSAYTQPLKVGLMIAYGDQMPGGSYELDHLIPLELGGDPRDPRNLWPQPWERDAAHPQGFALPGTGAQSKDRVENELHRRVCRAAADPLRVTLGVAQASIASDWRAVGVHLHVLG